MEPDIILELDNVTEDGDANDNDEVFFIADIDESDSDEFLNVFKEEKDN